MFFGKKQTKKARKYGLFVWWGWRDSPLKPLAAGAPRGAAAGFRCPAAENADTTAFSLRGFESL